MAINSFKDLLVWQLSIDLSEEIYTMTTTMPATERFGLTNQMRRAAVSISSNIAEGSKRSTRKDFKHFCLIALGSAAELETQLVILNRVYPSINTNHSQELTTHIQKMLTKLSQRLSEPLSTIN